MTSVCLVGKDCIVKEGLKGILARSDFELSDFEDAESLDRQAPASATLIINIDNDSGQQVVIDAVRRQKGSYPQSRVVILSGRNEVPVVAAAFATGADGYIMKDISADGFMGSLKLVLSGEKVFPPAAFDPANSSRPPARPGARAPLSERETSIIRHIASGDSNKAIAISLHIREATVKTHVKKILRKLNLANRTQAAVWAIANGLDKLSLPEQAVS